jgi:hypothetical protein
MERKPLFQHGYGKLIIRENPFQSKDLPVKNPVCGNVLMLINTGFVLKNVTAILCRELSENSLTFDGSIAIILVSFLTQRTV